MIVDSSFLISFYTQKDSNHEKAHKLMGEHEYFLLFPDYVVAETATVLLYKNNLRISKMFLETVENTKTIKILESKPFDFLDILHIFKNQKKQLSFVDACVVYHATRMGLGVLCFDKNINAEISRLRKQKEK